MAAQGEYERNQKQLRTVLVNSLRTEGFFDGYFYTIASYGYGFVMVGKDLDTIKGRFLSLLPNVVEGYHILKPSRNPPKFPVLDRVQHMAGAFWPLENLPCYSSEEVIIHGGLRVVISYYV